MGLTTPKLLMLGMVRFVAVLVVTLIVSGVILVYHGEILTLVWPRPESQWLVWAWHIVSWLLSFLLSALSAILSYLFCQLL